jgi:hypothetical protein
VVLPAVSALVVPGTGGEDLRRRVLQSELQAVGMDSRMTDELVDELAQHRLLTLDHDPVTGGATVEVAHEALIREWGQLRAWLDDSRDDIRQQRMLAAAASDWREADRPATCYPGPASSSLKPGPKPPVSS